MRASRNSIEMKRLLLIGFIIMSSIIITNAQKSFYDFKVKAIDGKEFDLSSLKGKKVMVVNTASECGNTPQYKKLEALYEKYKDRDSNQ
jgi:glutathione peroxidase